MIEQLKKFAAATRELNAAWDGAPIHIQEAANNGGSPSYPLDEPFEDFTFKVNAWVSDCINAIEKTPKKKYVFCIKDGNFERGWFYRAEIYKDGIIIVEEMSRENATRQEVSSQEYVISFKEIPEDMYNLALYLIENDLNTEDIRNLARAWRSL